MVWFVLESAQQHARKQILIEKHPAPWKHLWLQGNSTQSHVYKPIN